MTLALGLLVCLLLILLAGAAGVWVGVPYLERRWTYRVVKETPNAPWQTPRGGRRALRKPSNAVKRDGDFSVFLDSNQTSISEVVAAFGHAKRVRPEVSRYPKQRRLCDRDTCLRVVVADRIVGERLHRLRGGNCGPFRRNEPFSFSLAFRDNYRPLPVVLDELSIVGALAPVPGTPLRSSMDCAATEATPSTNKVMAISSNALRKTTAR